MRHERDELRDLLAADFVLGSMRGAARRRFATLMRENAAWRDLAERWEERLYPWVMAAPKVEAPPHVWQSIRARIGTRRPVARAPARWGWRLALASLVLAATVLVVRSVWTPGPQAVTLAAVLTDRNARPSLLLSSTSAQLAQRRLGLKVLTHPDMPPGTSWQAWLVEADASAPLSIGFVSAQPSQWIELSAAAADALKRATTIGVSVEPKGGAPTGRPSGPFLFEGPVLRLDE